MPDPEPNAAILSIVGRNRIVRHDATGADTLTILTEAEQTYSNLRPQPDGNILAFARLSSGGTVPGILYRMTTTGANVSPYAAPGSGPTWSDDGLRAGWLAITDSGRVIVLTNPDLSAPDTVATAEAFVWSSDRQALAITYRPTNDDQEIGRIDLQSSRDRVNLTNSPGDDLLPSWSPDGSTIAFYSLRAPQPGIYLMDADGTDQRLLTPAMIQHAPIWSPDSDRLAFIDRSPPANLALRIVRRDGSEVALPDSLAIGAFRFVWSPTGAYGLLSRTTNHGGADVYLTPETPRRGTRLLGQPSEMTEAVWIAAP